jgi:nucleotide-binding universal stress UspA family protein
MMEDPKLLVPIDASDPEELPLELVEVLHPMSVVVLGLYPVPDQTAPEQLRDENREEAKEAMEPAVRAFAAHGVDIESVLVFTRDRVQTTDRVANDYGCDAVLAPGAVERLDRIVVSLKDERNMFRVLEVVGLVAEASEPTVTLFHAESTERGSAKSELYLRGATDWLTERGIERERISWEEPTEETRESDLVELTEDNDFVVMGESDPGIRERVVGELPRRVHEQTTTPVLTVRKER